MARPILQWGQRVFARLGSSGAAALAFGLMVGVKTLQLMYKTAKVFIEQYWEIHGDNVKRAQVAWETTIKQISDLRIRRIQQAAEIEKEGILASSEIERKRIDNIREMHKNKLSMYSWELDMQQQLYNLEVERLQAQKQRDLLNKRVQNISDNANARMENNKEWNEGRMDWTYRGGFIKMMLGQLGAVDKYGGKVDQSIIKQAQHMAWFDFGSNGGWQTHQGIEDYVKMFQSMSQLLEQQ